jgi:DNA-binding NarL/FixJ family response regulator
VSDEQASRAYVLASSVLDRHAFCLLLRQELNLAVSVISDFSPTAIWDALRQKPTLAIVNCDQPSSAVVDAVQMIPRLRAEARVLVVSSAVEPAQVRVWAACRLHGYVVKDGGLPELKNAISEIDAGREFFSDGVRDALAHDVTSNGLAKLSRREAELLPLIARGFTLRDAAKHMSVSYKTAESYRTSLLRKLGVRDRLELARYAIRQKIVDP